MCGDGLTVRSQLRSRGHTHVLYAELDYPVTCYNNFMYQEILFLETGHYFLGIYEQFYM